MGAQESRDTQARRTEAHHADRKGVRRSAGLSSRIQECGKAHNGRRVLIAVQHRQSQTRAQLLFDLKAAR